MTTKQLIILKWHEEVREWYKKYGKKYKKALAEGDIKTLKALPIIPPPPDDGE